MPDYTRDFKARRLTDRPDPLSRVKGPVGKKFARVNLAGAANNPTRRAADMAEGQDIADETRSKYHKAKIRF